MSHKILWVFFFSTTPQKMILSLWAIQKQAAGRIWPKDYSLTTSLLNSHQKGLPIPRSSYNKQTNKMMKLLGESILQPESPCSICRTMAVWLRHREAGVYTHHSAILLAAKECRHVIKYFPLCTSSKFILPHNSEVEEKGYWHSVHGKIMYLFLVLFKFPLNYRWPCIHV